MTTFHSIPLYKISVFICHKLVFKMSNKNEISTRISIIKVRHKSAEIK